MLECGVHIAIIVVLLIALVWLYMKYSNVCQELKGAVDVINVTASDPCVASCLGGLGVGSTSTFLATPSAAKIANSGISLN